MFLLKKMKHCAQHRKHFRNYIGFALAAAPCCYFNFHLHKQTKNVYTESL